MFGRLAALIGGSSLAMVGYGAVLPYLYTDVASARGLGGLTAATMYTLFAVGALVASPLAGRLVDRANPVTVASWARAGAAAALALLAFGTTSPLVWLAAFGFGMCDAAVQPAVSVMLLGWASEQRRRDVFAWRFIGTNLGIAAGGVAGGLVADLSSHRGMLPVYAIAVLAELASGVVVSVAARGRAVTSAPAGEAPRDIGFRTLVRQPAIARLLAVTALLTLACYAQYESGLPAYALGTLHVSPRVLGIALALNAVTVAVLTGPVIALTRRHNPALLLGCCATIWICCWLIFGLPLLHVGSAGAIVVLGYLAISFGETVLSPVLTPLAASLAPPGAVGRVISATTGAQTAATAVGPALSGVLLAAHLPGGFIALQVGCCVGALVLLPRLAIRATAGATARTGANELVVPRDPVPLPG